MLEQTKEVGAPGEPLYLDVVNVVAQAAARGKWQGMPMIIGGRYGLSSKDFNPPLAKAVFDELRKPQPLNSFTVGINDDVSHTSLEAGRRLSLSNQPTGCRRCSTAWVPTARSGPTRTP